MGRATQKERKENSCFNHSKRILLEGYLFGRTGFPKITSRTQLAGIFKCDRKTSYNERARGSIEHTRRDLSTVLEYNAEYAQGIDNRPREAWDRANFWHWEIDTVRGGRGIERSCIDGKPRTRLFFAHSSAAGERGTNENHNMILRHFFAKD